MLRSINLEGYTRNYIVCEILNRNQRFIGSRNKLFVLIANFNTNASLNEKAKIAFLNSSAFCSFFKLRTYKKFLQLIN